MSLKNVFDCNKATFSNFGSTPTIICSRSYVTPTKKNISVILIWKKLLYYSGINNYYSSKITTTLVIKFPTRIINLYFVTQVEAVFHTRLKRVLNSTPPRLLLKSQEFLFRNFIIKYFIIKVENFKVFREFFLPPTRKILIIPI